MDPKLEQLMGRGKEAAGVMKDDDELRRDGKLDQFSGDVKQKGRQFTDSARHTFERGVDKAKDFTHRRT